MKLNRREFLTATGLGFVTALGIAYKFSDGDLPSIDFVPQWSGEITRLALLRDAIALAERDANLPITLRRSLVDTQGATGMGSLFPAQASVIAFLADMRRSWLREKANDIYRVAIATGYLMHHAAERRIQQALTAAGIGVSELDSAKLQQDAEVIRSSLAEPPKTMAEAQTLLSVLDQRLRIEIHTFIPDEVDEQAWIFNLLEWDAAQEVLFRELAEALATPDAAKRARYVEAPNFLDFNDPLLRTARSEDPARLTKTAQSEKSIYALALGDCSQVIALVGQFVNGSLDAEALAYALNQAPWS